MSIAERVRAIVEPLLAAQSLEVFDVEHTGASVRVLIERSGGGGPDLDQIAAATRLISRALDEHDPIPGRYTLEVSSPGLERPLRTPAHFARAIGAHVRVKSRPEVEGERRLEGPLVAADDDAIRILDVTTGAERTLRYDEIERARTVFDWGPPPKPRRARSSKVKEKQ